MAGTFGYELDLAKLTAEEKAEIRSQVAEYKKYADLIRQGNYYRLSDPTSGEIGAWMFVSEDGSEAFVSVVRLAQHSNAPTRYIRLKGLNDNAFYREDSSDVEYSGAALMYAGLPVPTSKAEYEAFTWHFCLAGPKD